MRQTCLGFFLALAIVLSGGCAYINIRTPYDLDLQNTELGTKMGTSANYSLFWLVAWGDGSYAAAARDGGIKVMTHSDQQVEQYFLGLYTKRTVIVYGD